MGRSTYNGRYNFIRYLRIPIYILTAALIANALIVGTNIQTADAEAGKILPMRINEQLEGLTGRCLLYETTDDVISREDIWVMYNALSDEDKAVYNLFLDLAKRQDPTYVSAVVIPEYKLKMLGEKYLWYVYSAMRHDHPEYFYLSASPDIINCMKISLDDYCIFFFNMVENDFSEEIQAFEDATAAFMEDIDLGLSDLEIEQQIHDKLIDLACYDEYNDIAPDEDCSDLKYTAYGALVANSEGTPNCALCRGYALAFEHLLHLAGIPCGYVSGEVFRNDSEQDESRVPHAWNLVRIEDKWYEVDATWDDITCNPDNGEEYNELMEQETIPYYNWRHHYFNRSTFEMRNLKVSDDTLFVIEGYYPYNPVKDTSHRRSKKGSDNATETDVFLNSLLPYAR